MSGGVALRRVERAADAPIAGLADLLIDVVDDGASVGFLAPLPRATAAAYWRGVADGLGDVLALWVAEIDGCVAGTVQLAPCMKDNGRHRADVQKLLVVRACRGRGIAAMPRPRQAGTTSSFCRSARCRPLSFMHGAS